MHKIILPAVTTLLLSISIYATAKLHHRKKNNPPASVPVSAEHPRFAKATGSARIQVAVLLDVSNSMDGLIEQAKAQLWNMVSVMGKASRNGEQPSVEIALYEYGRSSNPAEEGFIKQISGFTTDLDQLSQQLFSLTTDGGDEYCGEVIHKSLTEMNWDTASSSYKVIFIAGNEDFLQGKLSFTNACAEARNRQVIVNTIYCGDRMQGIREHWNLGSECGEGSYSHINADAKIEDIATPYDSVLFVLNDQLNKTYLAYGAEGQSNLSKQEEVDQLNKEINHSVLAKRVGVKGKKYLYSNDSWDMVDAQQEDASFYKKVDMLWLPDSLKTKSRDELKQIIEKKSAERTAIRLHISENTGKRDRFIAAEKTRSTLKKEDQTLETAIEKIIRQQAARFGLVIE